MVRPLQARILHHGPLFSLHLKSSGSAIFRYPLLDFRKHFYREWPQVLRCFNIRSRLSAYTFDPGWLPSFRRSIRYYYVLYYLDACEDMPSHQHWKRRYGFDMIQCAALYHYISMGVYCHYFTTGRHGCLSQFYWLIV
jgi:hypothetical protein